MLLQLHINPFIVLHYHFPSLIGFTRRKKKKKSTFERIIFVSSQILWREKEGKQEADSAAEATLKRPAGPRPKHTLLWSLKCDTLNQTNRASVGLTDG